MFKDMIESIFSTEESALRYYDKIIEDITFDYQQALGITPKPVNRKDKVIEVLKVDGPMGKDSLRKAVGGNTESFGKILASLARDGRIFIGKGLTKQGTRAKVLISLVPITDTD